MSSSVRVAVALGSNLGDREAHVDFALARLALLLTDLTASSRYETAPVGVQGPQPPFLNAVATGRSSLSAHDLLRALQQIEADRGRERPYANAPRTLDLDLIFFGDVVSADPHLTLPHPRFRERRFVLEPLAEIAPNLVDPVTGKTVRRLLEEAGE